MLSAPVTATIPATAHVPAANRSSQPTIGFRLPQQATIAELEAEVGTREVARIDEQARELEGVFLRMVMRRLQGSLGKTALGGSSQSEFMQSLAFDEMGDAMAGGRHQGLGLGRMIYEVLLRDEARNRTFPPPTDTILSPDPTLGCAYQRV